MKFPRNWIFLNIKFVNLTLNLQKGCNHTIFLQNKIDKAFKYTMFYLQLKKYLSRRLSDKETADAFQLIKP